MKTVFRTPCLYTSPVMQPRLDCKIEKPYIPKISRNSVYNMTRLATELMIEGGKNEYIKTSGTNDL